MLTSLEAEKRKAYHRDYMREWNRKKVAKNPHFNRDQWRKQNAIKRLIGPIGIDWGADIELELDE